MLASAENALLERLRTHRDVKRLLRTVASLPKAPTDKEQLARYLVDAPALYVVPGRFAVADDLATLDFELCAVVRNVAGRQQARLGDGIDLGVDHLVTLAVRALHGQVAGGHGWRVTEGEMADEAVYDLAGLAVCNLRLRSNPVELEADFGEEQIASLPDLLHVHADLDIAPQAGADVHAQWLGAPPNYTTPPDAQMDVAVGA